MNVYVDFIAGNDAYTGSTVSTPWKTLNKATSATTFLSPGDEIRVRGTDSLYTVFSGTCAWVSGAKTFTVDAGFTNSLIKPGDFISKDTNEEFYLISATASTSITINTNANYPANQTETRPIKILNLNNFSPKERTHTIQTSVTGDTPVYISGGWDATYENCTGYTGCIVNSGSTNWVSCNNKAGYDWSNFYLVGYSRWGANPSGVFGFRYLNSNVSGTYYSFNNMRMYCMIDMFLDMIPSSNFKNFNVYNSIIGALPNTSSYFLNNCVSTITGCTFYNGYAASNAAFTSILFNNNIVKAGTTSPTTNAFFGAQNTSSSISIMSRIISGNTFIDTGIINTQTANPIIFTDNIVNNTIDCILSRSSNNVTFQNNAITSTGVLNFYDNYGCKIISDNFFTSINFSTNNNLTIINSVYNPLLIPNDYSNNKKSYFRYINTFSGITYYNNMFGNVQLSGTNNTEIVVTPSGNSSAEYPLYYKIGSFLRTTGNTYTFTIKRLDAGSGGTIKVIAEQYGTQVDSFTINGSGVTSSYQTFSGTLTPTTVGQVDLVIEACCTTGSVFVIDKITLS